MGKKFFFAWILLVLAVVALYYQFSYQQKIRLDMSLVAQTLQVLNLLYELENNLATAESAAKDYLVSPKDSFLNRYRSVTAEIPILLSQLSGVLQDEPQSKQLLEKVQPLLKARLTFLDRQVQMRLSRENDTAGPPRFSSLDVQIPERLRNLLDDLEDEAKKRLNPQWAQQIDRDRRMVLVLTIVVLMSLSVLFCLSYLLALEVRRRRENEKTLTRQQEDLRTLATELSRVEEREHLRIGAHLHDQIGQSLALANIKLGELLAPANPPPGFRPDRLLEVRRLLEQAIHATQSLTFAISSPVLHQIGLEAALAWLTENFFRDTGLAHFFECDGQPKPLAPEVAVLLYQILAELLTNVVKHAQARHVKVSLWREGDRLQLDVEDDGVGFEVGELGCRWQEDGGYGLFCTRERLAPFGGSLTIDSRPGDGTHVTVSMPLAV